MMEEGKKRDTHREDITEDPKPSHTSRDPSVEQGGNEDSESESKLHDGKITGNEDFEDKTKARGYDGKVAGARKRRGASKTKVPDQVEAEDNHSILGKSAFWQTREGPLLSVLMNDGWGLIKTAVKLPVVLYPFWKWLLLIYVTWLAITYLVAFTYRSVTEALTPICAIPVLGRQMSFCSWSSEPKDQPLDVSKMTSSQDVLTVVMDQVGQNFDLARDMVGHEFAVRDLRIRIAGSNLSRKKELTRELESLIRYTKQTAKGLSRFTAKVGKSIDTVAIFDEYAVKTLEDIAERQRNPSTLPGRVISAITPFAAFSLANSDSTEEQVKHVFIATATRVSDRIKLLIDDSFDLGHNLDIIQETLDRIKELAVDEIGDLPQMDILGALWTRLARNDDYEEHKSHTSLLTDMTAFYKQSSHVMQETTAALNHIEAELSEFRDDFATPGLILKDNPLEVIIALLRKSGQRLEARRSKLGQIEEGQRPQKESTRVISATLA